MDCKDTRKLIQNHIDGEIETASFSEHLASCARCRSYYEQMLRQKAALASLAPERAPKFDLRAAKKQKQAQRLRTIRRISAAAAVFVAVIITGSLLFFTGARTETTKADGLAGGVLFDAVTETEEAPAADAPAADAPAADAPAEEAPMEEAPAEAPSDDCGTPLPPEYEEDDRSLYFSLLLSESDLEALQHTLEENHFLIEPAEDGFYLHHTDTTTHELLTELLAPYTEEMPSPDAEMIFIGKN